MGLNFTPFRIGIHSILRHPSLTRDASPLVERCVHRAVAKTIIHGDEHLGNLGLDGVGSPGFLDGCARIEPWAVVFTYVLIVTLDAIDRRA